MLKYLKKLTDEEKQQQEKKKWEAADKAAADFKQRAAEYAAQPKKAGRWVACFQL